jgi:hypothetical protein
MGGIEFLQTVQRRHGELPVVLALDGTDHNGLNRAQAAGIDAVVSLATQDYEPIIDRLHRLLTTTHTDRTLTQHADLTTLIHATGQAALTSTSRHDLETTVCHRLADSDFYALAWCSTYDPESTTLRPETAAGVDPAVLQSVPLADTDWATADPTSTDADTVMVEPPAATRPHTSLVTPLYDQTTLAGALHLTTTREPVDTAEQELVADLSTTIRHALAGRSSASEPAPQAPVDPPAVETVSGILTHELRNHIEVAQSYFQLVRDDTDHPHFDTIERALTRIAQFTEKTAVVARQEIPDTDRTACDVQAVATTAWDHVETADADLHADDSTVVRANRFLLEVLFENLFRNSIEHAGPAPDIHVGGEAAGLYITDTGPGIPPEAREAVFDWGYSGDDGSGIGLALVKRIVEAHGWEIAITERDGGGARFEISGVGIPDTTAT